jgi:hypothetical protein
MNRTLIVSVLLLASTAVFSQTPYGGMQACRNPWAEPSARDPANAGTNHGLRSSSA